MRPGPVAGKFLLIRQLQVLNAMPVTSQCHSESESRQSLASVAWRDAWRQRRETETDSERQRDRVSET